MAPSLPTTFNSSDAFVDYGRDLGITVGIGFLVPAVVLSLIQILLFVKFCCGKVEKKDVFSSKDRNILLWCSIIITATAVATCATGWSYNKEAHTQVQSASSTLQGVISSSANIMLSVNDTTYAFKYELLQGVGETVAVVSNISSLVGPIDNVFDGIENVDSAVHNLTVLTQAVVNNITVVKNDLNNLYQEETAGVISGVPSPNDVPDVGDQTLASLSESTTSINAAAHSVSVFSANINDTLDEVTATLEINLMDTINSYYQKVDEALSYFNEFGDKIRKTNNSYNDVARSVVHYSSIRMSIVAGILILPILLSAFSLVGVFFKLKALLNISAAFCFIFMFWYFLVAGLNYAAYYTADSFCQNQDVIANLISISKSQITIPGTNITESVPEKVQLLLRCSGNTTLIDVFNYGFFIDDLTNSIRQELSNVQTQSQQLNQTNTYITGLQELLHAENNSVNLDYLQNSNLSLVHTELNNLTVQLDNVINNPAYFQILQDVNDITNNLLLTNGTTIHEYYDSANITNLNCTTDPYNKLNQSTQQDLCEKAGTAIAYTIIRNRAILQAAPITGNITDINDRLYGFEESLPSVYYQQNQISLWANSIRANLLLAYTGAIGMVMEIENIINRLGEGIIDEVGDIRSRTQCAYVGDAYSDLTRNLCTSIRLDLGVISAMMIIGALVFFSTTIVSVVTMHKIKRDYYSDVM